MIAVFGDLAPGRVHSGDAGPAPNSLHDYAVAGIGICRIFFSCVQLMIMQSGMIAGTGDRS